MNVDEIIIELKVQLKLLKSMQKKLIHQQEQVKKVEEYTELGREISKIENGLNLLDIAIKIMK